jgi:tRNA(adenine34) deaminase
LTHSDPSKNELGQFEPARQESEVATNLLQPAVPVVCESLRRIAVSTDHANFMALAIEESRKGLRAGERPFGAVVVRGDEIIARTYSVVESSGDPTSHAETLAVRAATAHLKSPSLKGCTLYASCDPCPMCAGAIFNSHIERLVIGASSQALMRLTGRPPRSYSVEELSKQMNFNLEVIRGVLQDEAEKVLAAYKWPKV